MQIFIVEKNHAGQRLDKFLHKYLPQASTSFLYKMLRKKNITLNGKKAEGKEILQINDEIKCFFSEETFAKFSENLPTASEQDSKNTKSGITEYLKAYEKLLDENIRVIYEDDNILILNKPIGILTQKAENKDISLNEWMIGYLLKRGSITEKDLRLFKPSVCNRLDRNTSGLVLCGKSLAGSQKLNELIKNRSIKKYYRTICIGEVKNASILEANLTKDHKKNKVTIDDEGDAIKTAFTPIKKLKQNYTYLEVELITGKTHQIRAHLASIDHALVGDTKYGKQEVNQLFQKNYNLDSQLLHAYRLEFPVLDGEFANISEMVFLAPLPNKFEKILKDLK